MDTARRRQICTRRTVNALTATDVGVSPLPSVDGLRVLYYVWRADRKPSFSFWQVSAQGGPARLVCGDCDGSLYYWSNDEKKVIYFKSQSGGPGKPGGPGSRVGR